jgi:hypothetical protein
MRNKQGIKEIDSLDEYFVGRSKKLNQHFLNMRKWFFNFEPAFLERKINIKFVLASLKLTISEDFSERRKCFCSGFPFLSLENFLSVHLCRLSEQFSGSHAAFGTNFRVTAAIGKLEQAA